MKDEKMFKNVEFSKDKEITFSCEKFIDCTNILIHTHKTSKEKEQSDMSKAPLSNDQLIYLLQKEIEHNIQLAKELDYKQKEITRYVRQWNDFQFNNDTGSVNAWLHIKDFFETNSSVKKIFEEVSDELCKDGCFGLCHAMTATIEKLLEYCEED